MTINAERLLFLADFLDRVPPQHFSINIVVTRDATVEEFSKLLEHPDQDCKSAGCAMGWCPVAFPKLFRYGDRGIHLIGKEPIDEYQTYEAICEAFGITVREAYNLFEPSRYLSPCFPSDVATKIRKFVKGKVGDVADLQNRGGDLVDRRPDHYGVLTNP